MRAEPLRMGLGSLYKRPHRTLSLSLPCDDTVRRWPSANQGAGSHQIPSVLACVLSLDVSHRSVVFLL